MNASQVELNRHVDVWLRWYKTRRGLSWALHGLVAGLLLALAASLVAIPQKWLLREEYLLLAGLAALVGTALGLLVGFFWPVRRLDAARFFDRRFGLSERVSTALELAATGAGKINPALTRQQLEDTLAAAHTVQPRRSLPFRPAIGEILAVLLLVIASGSAYFWGEGYFNKALETRRIDRAIAGEIERVEELRQQIAQAEALTPAQKQALTEPLDEALRRLREAQTLEQAVSALGEAEQKLRALSEAELEEQARALQQAGQNLSEQTGSPLQEMGEKLAEGDLSGAADDLSQLDTSNLSQAEREALAQQLEGTAATLAQTNPELAERLSDAAQALRNGDTGAAQQALQEAAQSMAATEQELAEAILAQQTASGLQQGQRALVQSGQAALAQSGQAGQGGQSEQSGQGQSQQSGQGQSGGGAGRGEGDGEGAQGGEAGTNPIAQGNGPGDGGERPYEQIYTPERLGGEDGQGLALPSSGEPGDQIIGEGENTPGAEGGSHVPYVDVLPEYLESYRQAIESDQIPLHLRSLIRDYFSSLQP